MLIEDIFSTSPPRYFAELTHENALRPFIAYRSGSMQADWRIYDFFGATGWRARIRSFRLRFAAWNNAKGDFISGIYGNDTSSQTNRCLAVRYRLNASALYMPRCFLLWPRQMPTQHMLFPGHLVIHDDAFTIFLMIID